MSERARNRSTSEESQPSADGKQPRIEQHDGDRVARAAYQRYEDRGREDGHDVEDWLEAEREVATSPASESTRGGDDTRGE